MATEVAILQSYVPNIDIHRAQGLAHMQAVTVAAPASVAQRSVATPSRRPSSAQAAVCSSRPAQCGTKLASTAAVASTAARRAHLQVRRLPAVLASFMPPFIRHNY